MATQEKPQYGGEPGKRFIVNMIDSIAEQNPDRPWTLIPVNDADLSKGFKSITYAEWANAINRASWWLDTTLGQNDGKFPCYAFCGSKDLRIGIFAAAAMKTSRRMLLPSPMAPPGAQEHLLKATGCEAYVTAGPYRPPFDPSALNVPIIKSPELHELLDPAPVKHYPFQKSWEEHKEDPVLIFHTTGTTGPPKPMTYTNHIIMMPDRFRRATANVDIEALARKYSSGKWFCSIPAFHTVGMAQILVCPAVLESIPVQGPAGPGPWTPDTVEQILRYSGAEATILVPAVIEAVSASPQGLAALSNLAMLVYAGAGLRKDIGDRIAAHTRLLCGFGSTEVGSYHVMPPPDDAWDWLAFAPDTGLVMREHAHGEAGLYEAWFEKLSGPDAPTQQVFLLFPDADEFRTKDLFRKHPTLTNRWQFAGRVDDFFKLSTGYFVDAATLETALLKADQRIRSVAVGGRDRERPCVVVKADGLDEEELGRVVGRVNEGLTESLRIPAQLAILADPAREWRLTAKGTVSRPLALKTYAVDFEDRYRLYHASRG